VAKNINNVVGSNTMDKSFKFKKQYGQNFINDISIINRIVDSADIDIETLVIEVGPGAGILTKALCEKAKNVITYEVDKTLESTLAKELNVYDNVEIIFEDFINRNILEDVSKYEYKKLYFIANIPYYITNPIITKIIDSNLNFDKVIVMVQKEVGERFSAKPGSRAYGSLTVFLNYYFNIEKLFDVNRKYFHPVPNVDSVVVSLIKKEKSLVNDEDLFFKLIRDSFVHKRKVIRNNLMDYDLIIVERVLQENGLNLTCRAENIPLEVFVKLANSLK